jgi:hypothetical protein
MTVTVDAAPLSWPPPPCERGGCTGAAGYMAKEAANDSRHAVAGSIESTAFGWTLAATGIAKMMGLAGKLNGVGTRHVLSHIRT